MAAIFVAVVVWLAVDGAVLTPVAAAASATIAISADSPPPPPVPSGRASTYTINFTCSAVLGSTCGTNPTITIPLDLTSSNPATPDMSTWAYGASSSIPGLVASASVVGESYVIRLNESALQPGDSDTIGVSVTPPNNITPDQTTWSLRPSFQAGPAIDRRGGAVGGAGRRERHGSDLGRQDDQRQRRRVRPRQQRRLHDQRPLQPRRCPGKPVPHRAAASPTRCRAA